MRAGFLLAASGDVDFMIHGLFKYRLFGQEFWITTTHVSILVVMLVLFVFALAANRAMRHAQEVPGFFQNIVEMIVEMLDDMVEKRYLWLKKGLDINYPDRPISNYSYMASMENVDEICDMIAAFGTGITDYKLVEIPVKNVLAHIPNEAQTQMLKRMERYYSAVQNMIDHKISEDNNIPENTGIIMRSNRDFFILQIKGQKLVCQTIQFEHNKNNILFELSEESDGTVRILDLLEILLSDEGKTYVVDELDRCLHPSLTYKFIETYLKLAAKKNLQLIVTTHESRLLDFDLLRRDEIWFIDKQNTGESDIYSLEEYNTRFDQKIDKAYLEGRYGGVPVFNTIYRT